MCIFQKNQKGGRKVDNINLSFTPDAINEIASIAVMQNESHENIGLLGIGLL